jgi:tRNA pseudouridine(55) synthase
MNPPPDGLILLHKPPGLTSFDTLRDIKRILGTGKVGHTGTLDKFAEGLLLVLTGRALKLCQWFTRCDKRYEAVIRFGTETDTLDPEGAVIANAPLPSRENVEQAIPQFLGKIEQSPPVYSAIHIDGRRASELARGGESPEMQKRPVTIFQLDLLSWEPPYARIFVHCSSGTYIRSLARDIALATGTRAHLTALIRTQVGGFKLQGIGSREWGVGNGEGCPQVERTTDTHRQGTGIPLSSIEDLTGPTPDFRTKALLPKAALPPPHSPLPLLPIDKNVFNNLGIPCFDVALPDVQKVIQGKPLAQILKDTPLVSSGEDTAGGNSAGGNSAAALFSDGKFIAMIEIHDNEWKYGYVYARD